MIAHHYLAVDLGAESGRLISGLLADGKLSLREIHRFPNIPLREAGSLCWNLPSLILEVKEGLRKAALTGLHFASISADSWGVDYVLFDQAGAIMPPVHHYRDPRAKRGVEIAFSKVKWETIFAETGIQYMPINTLFQLASEDPARLAGANFLLGVGDAVNYFLSGIPKMEASLASTFQLYNPRENRWSDKLISALQFPRSLFPEIVRSGSLLGKMRAELGAELGVGRPEVIATCSHDTGAAVAGVPAADGRWAYLSSGTWSLMGVELPEPVINDRSRELNFTNEIGYGDTVRLLKNLSGLWLLQECRREWACQEREVDYQALTRMAQSADPFRSLIDPSSEEFLAPASMPAQIREFCQRTAQPVPENEGQFVRCCLESLALLYRRALIQVESLIGNRIDQLHVVGGGSNNDLLNQFSANALQIPVLAGPAEATAVGNLLIQALALGHIADLPAAREIVRTSTALRRFEPRDPGLWRDAFARFERLSGN